MLPVLLVLVALAQWSRADALRVTFASPTRLRSQRLSAATVSALPETSSTSRPVKDFLLAVFSGQALTDNIYVCPESLQPLQLVTRFDAFGKRQFFTEDKFGAKYAVLPQYVDFTTNLKDRRSILGVSGSGLPGQTVFQNPLMSAFYERGYRQSFQNAGFPGIEKEFAEALAFFTEANMTDIVMDLSCGSGFMTRKFVQSDKFQRVIAADLSPTMLAETRRRCRVDGVAAPELLRVDSARLPLAPASLSAIHAGAAMHCWPEIKSSLREVHRVLRPGGCFFATTFLYPLTSRLGGQQGFTMFQDVTEIAKLLAEAGFAGDSGSFAVRREGAQCIVVKAKKAAAVERVEAL